MFRKQIIILALLMLPMVPGASKIPEMAGQAISLQKQNSGSNTSSGNTETVQQSFMKDKGDNKESNKHKARQRYERARETKNAEKLRAMSEAEARRMMRTGDTGTYRSELQRYGLINEK